MKKAYIVASILISISVTVSAQTVSVSGRKITYTRQKPIAFFKNTFTIDHPKLKAATPALSRRIEAAISHSSVLGLNVREELNEIQWLEEADFEVLYNANGLLTIELRMNGTGAYPSGTAKTVVVDTRTGRKLTPTAVFRSPQRLSAMIDKALQKEIDASIAEIRRDPESKDLDIDDLFAGKRFRMQDLDDFAVQANGVEFKYDYGFAHVIKAYEPVGVFSFTWNDLKPFIRRDGALSQFLR